MGLFKRLSDSFWTYVSPTRPGATRNTPQTVPQVKKRGRPPKGKTTQHATGPSDTRVRSINLAGSPTAGSNKRKRAITPSPGSRGGQSKILKMDDVSMEYPSENEIEDDELVEEDDDDMDEVSSGLSNIRVARSESPNGNVYEESEFDDITVLSDEEYSRHSPIGRRMKVISPTSEMFTHGISTSQLRDEGWDDDHITVVSKIAMRGFEPLMPIDWKFDFRWMPNALFSADNNAFISSSHGDHFRGGKALGILFELGSRMRDRILLNNRVTSEQQAEKMMKAYIKWTEEDSGLDLKTAIPQIVVEAQPADTPVERLTVSAKRKLARLASRYHEAFKVSHSIEGSPSSNTSSHLSYPVPTLYAIIASQTLVAIGAYNPNSPESDLKKVAFLDMSDRDYDVWNAFALAIVACHVRNVQLRIAEEIGLGFKTEAVLREEEEEKRWQMENDPDL